MNEECDAHELNLFIQDKLSEVIPQSNNCDETFTCLIEEPKSFANPLFAVYQISIECQVCKLHGCEPITGQEHHLDINVNIPSLRKSPRPASDLIDLVA